MNASVISSALGVGLLVALGLTIPLARGDAKSPTIPVSEIHEGMKGYGLTVFQGVNPERFDVEVIGVLHNFRPSQDLILVKTPHPRLNITKNVRGMSGSPIFLDGGRLAGAYAYSWALFPTEPVAGVTPIAPMLTELHRAIPPGFWPLEGRAPLPGSSTKVEGANKRASADAGGTSWDGEPGHYDLDLHAKEIAKRVAIDPSRSAVPASTPIMMSGVGDRAAAYARTLFEPLGMEPLQGGGGQGPKEGAPEHFVDGGALGVQFVSGDVSMMGLGTVTHVEGTRLCGFGHPMFEAGNTAFPTSIGRVIWIYASENHSTKIGEIARPLGALVNDRQSAIVVDEKAHAPTFPVDVVVKGNVIGAPKTSWHGDVAEERFMTPSLLATFFGSVVEATAQERRDMTWKLVSKLTIEGHPTIELEDFGVAIGGMPDPGDFGHARVVRAVGDLLNNPWTNAHVTKIESVLTAELGREVWRLRGVDALDGEVDAGKSARVVVHLVPFQGPEIQKTLDVPIPAQLAGKDAEIEVLPGWEVSPEMPSPESLTDMIANEVRQSYLPKSLVTQVKLPEIGVAFHGHVAPELPPFAMSALRPESSDDGPEPFISYARTTTPVAWYVEGHDKVKIKVRAVVR